MSGDFKFNFSKKPKGKKAVKPVPENLDENAKEYRVLAVPVFPLPRRDGAVA